jgi:hypothetical protein
MKTYHIQQWPDLATLVHEATIYSMKEKEIPLKGRTRQI